jgi:hypothetical protein
MRFLTTFISAVFTTSVAVAVPPNPARPDPPPGLADRAVRPGGVAPALSLPSASGPSWSLAAARADGPVVLVFYRGDW